MMDDFDQFERKLAAALRSDADTSLARFEPVTVASAAMDSAQHRSVRIRRRFTIVPTSTRWTIAAAAVIGVIVVGGLYYVNRPDGAVGGPSPTPSASPSQPAVVGPSATPTATPSPTPTPLLWTEASLKEDWPVPVRSEPVGEVIVLPFDNDSRATIVPDALGDAGSDAHPWVDIRQLQGSGAKFSIELVDNHPPLVDPTKQWIAYGVVVDDDGDGIPDWRYGIDNLPVDPSGWAGNPDSERMAREQLARGSAPHRAWRTNLHTGRTEAAAGPPYGDTFYPPGGGEPSGARFGFGGDIAGGGTNPGLVDPFYAWASVIVDGRVVATDYAPDVGWLVETDP